jgi:hypothetical protein
MRQIFKYPVDKPIVGRIEKFLHIEYQHDTPMIWAIVDDACPQVEYLAVCSGTGWPLPDYANEFSYVGTLQDDGGYVWHYFVVPTSVIKATRAHSYDAALQGKELKTEEEDEFEINEETVKTFHEQMLNYLRQSLKS